MRKILLFTVMCLFGFFNLNAQETTFSYDFNDGSLEEWNVFQGADASADCPNWAIGTSDDFRGGPDGSKTIYSMSSDVNSYDSYTPDNYIVTKKAYTITSASKLSWWVNYDNPMPGVVEKYSVVVSETGAEDSFEVVGEAYNSGLNVTETCDLSAYSGKTLYIGFHHFYNEAGEAALILDNITLTVEEGGDDNTGDDNTGDDNTGDDNTGDDNTGDDNTGDDNTGDDNTGDDNTGETVTAPAEPTVTATATSDASIVLVWNKVEGATSYKVHHGTETLADALEDTTYTVNGLKAETEYSFNVQACNEAGCSAYTGGAASAKTLAATSDDNTGDETTAVLATPVVTAVASDSSVVLTWNKIEGATSYNIFQDSVAIDTVAAPDTTFTVLNLSADSLYVFFVQAENADTVSAKSDSIEVRTLPKADDEEGEGEYLVFEDFENLLAGDKLAEKGGSFWTTWNNKPGTAEDAEVVELDGNKCAHMTFGVDQVLLLGGYQTGVFDLEFEVLIPAGNGGYLNVLHEFDGDNSAWAMQAYFQMKDNGEGNPTIAAGHGSVHAGKAEAGDIPCVYDAWMHFRLHVDADTDEATLYYTNSEGTEQEICKWQWSQDSFGETVGGRKLDAMNFYPMSKKSEYYVDNISLKRIGEPTAAELTFNKESVDVKMNKDDITTVEFTVENTGTSIADYVAWVDYGMGEISDKNEIISYADEDITKSTSIGWESEVPVPFEIAAFFPAESYSNAAAGTYIAQAAYFLGEFKDQDGNTVPMLEEGTDLIFRIYGQGSNGYPGEVLAEKVIPADSIILDWNLVTFDTPVALSGFDFYVAVEMTQCVKGAPMIFDGDKASALQGFGDLVRQSRSATFRSVTDFTDGQYYGSWQLAVNCLGNAVKGGWAELKTKEIYLQIGESKTISLDVNTTGLQYSQKCEANLVFSTTASEEDVSGLNASKDLQPMKS